MQTETISNMPSIKMEENGDASGSISPLGKEFPLTRSSVSIYNLKLCDFIDCLVDENYESVGGDKELFEKIYEEYSEALISPKEKYILGLVLEIKTLEYKRVYANAVLTFLKSSFDETIADRLVLIGAVETKCPTDPLKIEGWFKRISGRLKRWDDLIRVKTKEIERMSPKKKSAPVTRKYFDEMLIELSSLFKYNVSEREISVSKYTTMISKYREATKKK